MPRSKAPRKKARVATAGMSAAERRLMLSPNLRRIRDQLILPAHVGLRAMEQSDDRDALQTARDMIAATLDWMCVALTKSNRDVGPVDAALEAFIPIATRFDAGGSLRGTGEQIQILRRGITYCDEMLGTLRFGAIAEASIEVAKAVDKINPNATTFVMRV